jgi:hypothetical protein
LTSQISLPSKPFGSVVDTIDIKTLLIEEDTPKIQDVEYIASYNWLDSKSPVILVPGQSYTYISRNQRENGLLTSKSQGLHRHGLPQPSIRS